MERRAVVALRVAATVALVPLGSYLVKDFWIAANHAWLAAWMLAAAALAKDSASLRRAFAVMAVALLVWSGVQKAWHGYYLAGDFFIVAAAQPQSKFSAPMRLFMSDEDAHALDDFQELYSRHVRRGVSGVLEADPPQPRAARAASALMCWGTLVAELVLPWFLLWSRTRRRSLGLLVAFFVIVEAVAVEWKFAGVLAVLMAPFLCLSGTQEPRKGWGELGAGLRILLVLFVLWPAAHLAMVAAMDLNPWKLGGYGMYSVPARLGGLAVEQRNAEERRWEPVPARDDADARFRYRRDFRLRCAPFAFEAAREVAGSVQVERGPGAVRVRSLTMLWDRAAGRFRLEERVYVFP